MPGAGRDAVTTAHRLWDLASAQHRARPQAMVGHILARSTSLLLARLAFPSRLSLAVFAERQRPFVKMRHQKPLSFPLHNAYDTLMHLQASSISICILTAVPPAQTILPRARVPNTPMTPSRHSAQDKLDLAYLPVPLSVDTKHSMTVSTFYSASLVLSALLTADSDTQTRRAEKG